MLRALTGLLHRDLNYAVANQIVVSGINFAVGIAAARALGLSDFGLFALILLMFSLTSSFEEYVNTIPMMTLAGRRRRRSPSYFATVLAIGLGSAAATAIFMALFVMVLLWMRGQFATPALVGAAALVTFGQSIQITTRKVLFAKRKPAHAVMLDGARLLLLAGAVGALVATGTKVDVAGALAVLGASALLAAFPFLVAEIRHPIRRHLPMVVLRRHWPISSWLLLMMLVSIGQEQALWIFANLRFGDEATGALRAGQYLLGTTHLLAYAIENFMPRMAAEEIRGRPDGGPVRYLLGQTMLVWGASLALIVLIAVFAEPLLVLFFGPEFGAHGGLTRIFALVYAVTILRTIWVFYLRAVERTRDVFVSYVFSTVTALVVIVPLSDRFGVAGVALTMAVAQTTLTAGILFHVARHAMKAGAPAAAPPRIGLKPTGR